MFVARHDVFADGLIGNASELKQERRVRAA